MSKAVQKLTVAASQVGCNVSDIPGPSEDWAPCLTPEGQILARARLETSGCLYIKPKVSIDAVRISKFSLLSMLGV